jgi:SAM-dependent methyltransferase
MTDHRLVFVSDEVRAGQAAYSPLLLQLYDFVVLGIINRTVWRCPSRVIRALYLQYTSAHHLDAGVGTGYFLDHPEFDDRLQTLTLLDLNRHSLHYAAHRLRRYDPNVVEANVLEPIDLPAASHDSIGVNFVLHCLPGTIDDKSLVFQQLRSLLRPGGVLFGSTVLASGVEHTKLARAWLGRVNRRRIFCNTDDDLAGLDRALRASFSRHCTKVVGSVALFVGWL